MSLRKPGHKRRMYHDPQREQKLAFMLARQLHLQDTQQQRPFPETSLGKLPGEIRNIIYEHLLVAPPSQTTRYLRVPGAAVIDPNEIQTQGSHSTPTQALEPGKPSYVAILQTCRQVNREAYHVFYAKNSFLLTNLPDLIAFLKGIGPVRRAELTSLHVEGMTVDEMDKDALHRYCLRYGIDPAIETRFASFRVPFLHPDIFLPETKKVLAGCKKLSKLVLEFRAEEGFNNLIFLRFFLGLRRPVIYLVDESHWIVEARRHDGVRASPKEAATKFLGYKDRFPGWARGNKVRVEVDIIRDSEQAEKKGFESWIAID